MNKEKIAQKNRHLVCPDSSDLRNKDQKQHKTEYMHWPDATDSRQVELENASRTGNNMDLLT